MIVTNKYKCDNMFKKNVKYIPIKCKPTFGTPCTCIYIGKTDLQALKS
jgi:hypothetical protein